MSFFLEVASGLGQQGLATDAGKALCVHPWEWLWTCLECLDNGKKKDLPLGGLNTVWVTSEPRLAYLG